MQKAGKRSPQKSRNSHATGRRGHAREDAKRLWLYGRHAVAAALANPDRRIRKLLMTKNAAGWLETGRIKPDCAVINATPAEIDRCLSHTAVHQGIAAEVYDLPRDRLKNVCANPTDPVLVLDQITDPQNIGAIFRSAAAFGARAIIVQDRRTPPLSGALAKAAAGAIEKVPCVRAVNIARSLDALSDLGYVTVGLSGAADRSIDAVEGPMALVLGAEGSGLRPLVAETCNQLAYIPIKEDMESLNVSTAAAIALYETTRGQIGGASRAPQ